MTSEESDAALRGTSSGARTLYRWSWIALGAVIISLPSLSGTQRAVFLPLAASILIALLFGAAVVRRAGRLPLDDIGLWYVITITVYTVMPLLVFLLVGLRYTPLNDLRLWILQPGPETVARMGWWYVAYLTAFAVCFLAVRRRTACPMAGVPVIRGARLIVVLTLLLLINGLFLVLAILYPTHAESYAGSYAAIANLPLGVRQVLRLTKSMDWILTLCVLVWLFNDYRRRRGWILAWFVYKAAGTFIALGARSELMLFLMACMILYHIRVRPIRLWTATAVGMVGLLAFLALGVLRNIRASGGQPAFQASVLGGEFEAIFANALDLQHKKAVGKVPPLSVGFYLSDVVAVIPSQLLPFQKIDAAVWYMRTFYPEQQRLGNAYAFGVVPQALVEFGLPDLVLTGAFMGLLFGLLYNYYVQNRHRFWVVVGYLWITLTAYQTFRATRLALLSPFVQQFLFTLLIVEIWRQVLVGAVRGAGRTLGRGAEPATIGGEG